MNTFYETSNLVRRKNTHSLSLNKLQTLAKSQSPPSFLPQLIDNSPTSPRPTNISKNLNLPQYPESESKGRDILEMIGVTIYKDKKVKSPGLKVDLHSPRIALTDFMGKNKYDLIKRAGCTEYYDQYKKNREFQKIIDQKNTFSFPNIVHNDMIRENSIRNPVPPRSPDLGVLFEKQKYGKQEQGNRVDAIQKIIDKCDDLFKETKKIRDVEKEIREDVNIKMTDGKRRMSRRSTIQDRLVIKKKTSGYQE